MDHRIRKGKKADIPAVLELVKELAAYEKAPNEVVVTREEMERDGFGPDPAFKLLVAEKKDRPGTLAGIALYYYKYSTWKGRALYLEDIIVTRDLRRSGIGAALFEQVVNEAAEHGVRRMEWQVLDWNEPAIRFYEKYGAHLDPEWINGQLTGHQIQQIARNYREKK